MLKIVKREKKKIEKKKYKNTKYIIFDVIRKLAYSPKKPPLKGSKNKRVLISYLDLLLLEFSLLFKKKPEVYESSKLFEFSTTDYFVLDKKKAKQGLKDSILFFHLIRSGVKKHGFSNESSRRQHLQKSIYYQFFSSKVKKRIKTSKALYKKNNEISTLERFILKYKPLANKIKKRFSKGVKPSKIFSSRILEKDFIRIEKMIMKLKFTRKTKSLLVLLDEHTFSSMNSRIFVEEPFFVLIKTDYKKLLDRAKAGIKTKRKVIGSKQSKAFENPLAIFCLSKIEDSQLRLLSNADCPVLCFSNDIFKDSYDIFLRVNTENSNSLHIMSSLLLNSKKKHG